jgi:hypothetical protein
MAVKTPTLEHILAEVRELSAVDQVRLMERLFGVLERKIKVSSDSPKDEKLQEEWREIVRSTSGVLADDPIEHPPQGDYEQREAK